LYVLAIRALVVRVLTPPIHHRVLFRLSDNRLFDKAILALGSPARRGKLQTLILDPNEVKDLLEQNTSIYVMITPHFYCEV
jgi:hypothetical protein